MFERSGHGRQMARIGVEEKRTQSTAGRRLDLPPPLYPRAATLDVVSVLPSRRFAGIVAPVRSRCG